MAHENGGPVPNPKLDVHEPLLGDQLQQIKHPPLSQGFKDRMKPFQNYCRCCPGLHPDQAWTSLALTLSSCAGSALTRL